MSLQRAFQLVDDADRTGVRVLDLSAQKLNAADLARLIPEKIRQLINLTGLDLDGNQLTDLPPVIGLLTKLTELRLYANELAGLPAVIGLLTNLTGLDLGWNRLTDLPPEIGQLTKLIKLNLYENKLADLPPEIGRLTNLTGLYLDGNLLIGLPPEIGQLTNLTELYLGGNQLTNLPPEIGRLTNLAGLDLYDNGLTDLPPEIGQLANLTRLDLGKNKLTTLPAEIGRLTKLTYLNLEGNPLIDPPLDIARQGVKAVIAHINEKSAHGATRLGLSKLVLVGNADVGKTCTLASLLDEPFNPFEKTTHGMSAHRELSLPHPDDQGSTMRLSAWDFGGQQINHATHQFFLTDRALCLLVWDARHDPDQDRLEYWLEMIKTRAPESPVIVVATHIDEREPWSLPLETWRARYPIAAALAISNKPPRRGLDELKKTLARVAADLPLMKAAYPANWIDAMKTIKQAKQNQSTPAGARPYYPIESLRRLLDEKHGLRGDAFEAMIRWYHDLGGMLYFPEDPELRDIAILNPWQVNRLICQVFNHKDEDEDLKRGILTSKITDQIWSEWAREYHPRLIRLMERFDLARRIPDTDQTLVVDCLPVDPPDYGPTWEAARGDASHREIAMIHRFNAIPAGVPTWFIAREHRFSTGLHWRYGVLLADRERAHYGLLRCDPKERRVDLAVRGPYPANFFALLKHGLELTLERHPGLEVQRAIPCPCGNGVPCGGEFEYDAVLKAQERGRERLDCPKTFDPVSVERLLYGLERGGRAQDAVLFQLEQLRKSVDRSASDAERRERERLEELRELSALVQREFLTLDAGLSKEFQMLHQVRCPDVFLLRPAERGVLSNPFSREMKLHLLCQAPGCWHPVGEEQGYPLKEPAKWLQPLAPHLRALLRMLKTTMPAVAEIAGYSLPSNYREGLEWMDQFVQSVEESPHRGTLPDGVSPARVDGAALRNLRSLMDHLDPRKTWGGLEEIRSREGHYLWLCPDHARAYK